MTGRRDGGHGVPADGQPRASGRRAPGWRSTAPSGSRAHRTAGTPAARRGHSGARRTAAPATASSSSAPIRPASGVAAVTPSARVRLATATVVRANTLPCARLTWRETAKVRVKPAALSATTAPVVSPKMRDLDGVSQPGGSLAPNPFPQGMREGPTSCPHPPLGGEWAKWRGLVSVTRRGWRRRSATPRWRGRCRAVVVEVDRVADPAIGLPDQHAALGQRRDEAGAVRPRDADVAGPPRRLGQRQHLQPQFDQPSRRRAVSSST